MAKKRKKRDIDLITNIIELLLELGPKGKDALELMIRRLFDELGPDAFLAELSAEQRVELVRRLQADASKKKRATTP